MTVKPRRAPLRLNALTVALMTKAMMEGPCTYVDLEEACGLTRQSIHRYIKALRSVKAAHVSQWEQDSIGRFVVKAYSFGDAKDKPRPPKFAGTLEHRRQKATRAKQKAMNHMMAGSMGAAA
jgi:hypothetical protein